MIFLPIDRRKTREKRAKEAEYATKAASESIEAKYLYVCVRARGVHDTVSVVPVSSYSASSRIIHEKKWGRRAAERKRGTKIARRLETARIDKQPAHNGIKRRARFFGNFNNANPPLLSLPAFLPSFLPSFLPAHYVRSSRCG